MLIVIAIIINIDRLHDIHIYIYIYIYIYVCVYTYTYGTLQSVAELWFLDINKDKLKTGTNTFEFPVSEPFTAKLWDIDSPNLYS